MVGTSAWPARWTVATPPSPSLLLRVTLGSQGHFQPLPASILLDSVSNTEEGEGPQGPVGWAGVGGFCGTDWLNEGTRK